MDAASQKVTLDLSQGQSWFTLEAAWWLHDVIYDARADDNEERSAQYAHSVMLDLRAPEPRRIAVQRLVLATKHSLNRALSETDERLIVDIDLAVAFGGSWEEFSRDTLAVREEFQHVPDTAWRKGRQGVLQQFLDRTENGGHLYYLPYFQEKYEINARANLKREIIELG